MLRSSEQFHTLRLLGHVGLLVPFIDTVQKYIVAGRVAGSVVGGLVLVAAIVTVISIYFFFMWRRKQRVKKLQMDIFARYISCLYSQYFAVHDCLLFSLGLGIQPVM